MKQREKILASIATELGRMYGPGGDETAALSLAEIVSYFPVLDEALDMLDDATNRIEDHGLPNSNAKGAIQ